jgi:hypothetical protein
MMLINVSRELAMVSSTGSLVHLRPIPMIVSLRIIISQRLEKHNLELCKNVGIPVIKGCAEKIFPLLILT